MKIIYGYSNCSDRLYEKIFKGKELFVMRPDQKYHGLLIKGLAKNNAEVYALSGLPINRNVTKKLFIHYKNEKEDGVRYKYYKTINLPFLRQAGIFFGGFFSTLFFKKKKEKTVAVCDILNVSNCYGITLAAKLRRIPVICIVTDLPDILSGKKVQNKINNRLFKKADGFIFLTQAMNDKVNVKNKPYIVAEGHVCENAAGTDENHERENTVVYAGGISEEYGLKNLIEGFRAAALQNTKLLVFGDGPYAKELEKICAETPNADYRGVKPNAEVIAEERRASLLINPRPTDAEFTKYSFPSKNMEYMASGTPLLTTALGGMPEEYKNYVYLIEKDGADGVAEALKKVFSLTERERAEKGAKAKEFVLTQKSNVAQAKRILDFAKTL